MTIGSNTPRVSFNCNGVTTVFPVNLQAYLASDFTVTLTNSTGGEATLVLNSDYSLVPSGTLSPTYWTLTTLGLTPYPTLSTLQAFVNPTQVQQAQFVQNQAFPSLTVQTAFDRLTQMVLRLQDQINRSTRAPDGDVNSAMLLPIASARAGGALIFDANGNPVIGVPVTGTISTAVLAPFLGLNQTPAELIAGVTPVNLQANYWDDPRRYGAALDGVTDDTAAIQNWAKVAGNRTFPALTGIVSGPITLSSNTTIRAAKGALVQTAVHDISIFAATGKANIAITGLHFKYTSVGTVASVGGVAFTNCTDCTVENNEFEGMQFSGIFASACTRCTFRANYIHDCLGAMQNSGDIYIESSAAGGTSSYNVIDGNFCYGPSFEFGIAVWDPYAGVLPVHNIVANNRIKAHNGYGILIYMPTAGDSYNQVIGNHVQDISAFAGLPMPNTDSGAGIYVAGAGMGGTEIIGNTVNNCCITTTTASLAPAGIGINGAGLTLGTVPLVISGNIVEGMTKYYGILLTGCLGGASVIGNTIRMPATNTTGDALRVVNADSVNVANNTILQANATTNVECIVFAALGVNSTNCSCTGNSVRGGHHSQIRCLQSGGFQVQILSITGNILSAGDGSCIPIILDTAAAADVMITGNIVSSQVVALQVNAATAVRVTGNRLRSVGTTVLQTTGVCTSSYYDKTNNGTGIGVGVSNGATLFLIEHFGSAAPVAGLWAVGDRIEQSVPVVGNPKGWRCTVAGSPGSWVSEGNL